MVFSHITTVDRRWCCRRRSCASWPASAASCRTSTAPTPSARSRSTCTTSAATSTPPARTSGCCAPKGTGTLYVREELLDRLWVTIASAEWQQPRPEGVPLLQLRDVEPVGHGRPEGGARLPPGARPGAGLRPHPRAGEAGPRPAQGVPPAPAGQRQRRRLLRRAGQLRAGQGRPEAACSRSWPPATSASPAARTGSASPRTSSPSRRS